MTARNEMLVDIKSLKADTFALSTVELGAYMLLLFEMHQSSDGCVSEAEMQKICRMMDQNRNWKRVWNALEKFLIITRGRVTQKRIQRDRLNMHPESDSGCKMQSHIESKPLTSTLPSKSKISESSLVRTDVRKRVIPDEWTPTLDGKNYAKDRGLIWTDELEAFKDYHAANVSRFADWSAAWRMWCRNAVKFNKRDAKRGTNGKSAVDAWDRLVQRADGATEDCNGGEVATGQLPFRSIP